MSSFRIPVMAACFMAAFGLHAQAGAAVHATLRAEVTVDGRAVTLGDIADLSGMAGAERQAMAKIRLTLAPEPGYTLHLTAREVTHLLHEAGAPDVALDGAAGTIVTASSVALDMQAVVETAEARLRAASQHDGLTLELAPQNDAPELRVPRGTTQLQARDMGIQPPRSRMTVKVDVLLDGGYYRTVPVTFSVSATGPVFVTRKNLAKGTIPGCADLELQQRDVAALASPPQAGDCENWARRLKRDLPAGEPLLAGQTEAVPTVSEGQYVTLKVAAGAVVIESRARALTDGEIGQRIAVRPTTSDEAVMATVVAPGLVNLSTR